MKEKIAISDLTRMHRGKVCIAGYLADRTCVRPVLPPPGIPETSLISGGKPVIFPFSVIEVELMEQRPQPPHTEDWLYDPQSVSYIRSIHDRKKFLEWSLFDHVGDIFGQPVHTDLGFYVMDCFGTRSVGTVKPRQVFRVAYEPGNDGTWDYRLLFNDFSGANYRLKITDLTWHYYCDSLRSPDATPAEISIQLTEFLQSSQVYLRIGLSRGWDRFPDRCFLQVNGIYTFPDYLEGKTFFDFAPYRAEVLSA